MFRGLTRPLLRTIADTARALFPSGLEARQVAGRQGTIALRFAQTELADLLGASRQKTNPAPSTLAEAKAFARRNGGYVCNVATLRKFARAG